MPAIRVDIPAGIAGPVWLAHVFRVALLANETGKAPPNTPSLRVQDGDNFAPGPEGLNNAMHAGSA